AMKENLHGAYDVHNSSLLPVGDLVDCFAKSQNFRASQIRLPALIYRGSETLFDLAARFGISAAFELQPLFGDIFVGHGANALDALNIKTGPFFPEAAVLKNGVFSGSVAVIGASGFIGSTIAKNISDHGRKVRCGIHQSPFPFENIEESNIEFVSCDTANRDALRVFFNNQKAVIYAGGLTTAHGEKSWEDYLKVNTEQVINFVGLTPEEGIKSLIFLASQAPPHGKYGYSKSLGEAAVATSDLDYTILKPGLVVGNKSLAAMIIKFVNIFPIFPLP